MNRNRRNRRRIAGVRRMMFGVVMCMSLAMALMPVARGASQTEGDESSYTDPDFGWSISWDPELWMTGGTTGTTPNAEGLAGAEVIIAGIDQMALGVVFVGSQMAFEGDTASCLEAVKAETWLMYALSDGGDADLELPQAPDNAERSLSFATITDSGFSMEGVLYVECRPLVEDEALLSIRWIFPDKDTYDDALPDFEDLIANVSLEGESSEEEAASETTAQEDEAAEFTDPIFGWSIIWDPAVWEGQEPGPTLGEDDKEGTQFDLYAEDLALGGVTVASLPSPTFANDLAACVDFLRPQTHEELEGDGAFVDNLRELDLDLPEAPSDAVRKLFEWDAGGDQSQIGYFECRPLVEGEAVLLIKWTLPVGEPYEAHLPDFEELMSGLDLSEAHSE